jgi:RNA ligase (TIGR02306 family)
MKKSTHKVEVVPVVLKPHPNADSLSVVEVFGYSVCVRTDDWQGKSLGAYIPPDSVVPDTPEFAFLKGRNRIRVVRLRGVMSQGLLVPAPEGASLGDDVAERLGVTHYDPPLPASSGGESEAPPPGLHFSYDVDTWYRFKALFVPGEEVIATEKIHGASARYVWQEGRLFCGSRNEWKREDSKNLWWRAARETPGLIEFCQEHPEITVYGEVYGRVQDLQYGTKPGEVRFVAFDLLRNGQWLSHDEAQGLGAALPWVPLLYRGPYDEEKVRALADGPSTIPGANHLREGVVVKPVQERTALEIGRVLLKIVSNQYLERA